MSGFAQGIEAAARLCDEQADRLSLTATALERQQTKEGLRGAEIAYAKSYRCLSLALEIRNLKESHDGL